MSDPGNGAVIQLVPDAPVNLADDPLTTSDVQIRFTWQDGASDGGIAVQDYTVFYDQGNGNYIEVESGVTTQYYLKTDLTPGTTYAFKVQARNAVGFSLDSQEVSILAAKIPEAPINLANNVAITTAYQIGLTWDQGVYNGGSAVIDYRLSYKESTSNSFTYYATDLTNTQLTVVGLTPGILYDFKLESRNVKGYSPESGEIRILAAQIPDQPEQLANDPTNTNAH